MVGQDTVGLGHARGSSGWGTDPRTTGVPADRPTGSPPCSGVTCLWRRTPRSSPRPGRSSSLGGCEQRTENAAKTGNPLRTVT